MSICVCFFFKQKTAYEMRISDWSSDVCSSDLKTAVVASAMADVGDTRRALTILRPHVTGGNAKPETQLEYVNVLLKGGQEAEAAAWIRSLEQNSTMTDGDRRQLAEKAADLAVLQAERAREAGSYAEASDTLYPHLAQNTANVGRLLRPDQRRVGE